MEAQQAVNLFARGQYPVIALIVRKCYGSTLASKTMQSRFNSYTDCHFVYVPQLVEGLR